MVGFPVDATRIADEPSFWSSAPEGRVGRTTVRTHLHTSCGMETKLTLCMSPIATLASIPYVQHTQHPHLITTCTKSIQTNNLSRVRLNNKRHMSGHLRAANAAGKLPPITTVTQHTISLREKQSQPCSGSNFARPPQRHAPTW